MEGFLSRRATDRGTIDNELLDTSIDTIVVTMHVRERMITVPEAGLNQVTTITDSKAGV